MNLKQHYAALLGLSKDWKVTDVQLQLEDSRVEIHVKSATSSVRCPCCDNNASIHDHAPERKWRHLDTMQFETVIVARLPRCNCKQCGGVKTVKAEWAEKSSRFTLMFEAFALSVLEAASDINKAASLLRLNWSSLQSIMDRAVERGIDRRKLEGLQTLGIDEKSFRRSQSYIGVLSDLDEGRVIDIVEGRKTNDAKHLLEKLPEGTAPAAIAMDMWPAFIRATKESFPEAKIVFDRFHVSKLLNEAVDKTRRWEHKLLKQKGDASLTGTKFIWMKSPKNTTLDQKLYLEEQRAGTLKTARAWAIKEEFNENFWSSPNEAFGEASFDNWYSWAIRSRLIHIKSAARTLKKHLWGLLSYFEHPISNAASEGLNSRIQSIKSQARGFRSFRNYRTRILFHCGKLEMRPEITH